MRNNKSFQFYKYTSAGNDFIVIEGEPFHHALGWATLCNRRFGIGADGVLFLAASMTADFRMVYLNADGGEVGMCGNGARALVAHQFKKHPEKQNLSFEVRDTLYRARRCGNDYSVEMNQYSEHGLISLQDLSLPAQFIARDYLNTGVPHLVFESNADIDDFNLEEFARPLRYDLRFKEGVNVNIYYRLSKDTLKMRTYERGVEGETFACGTGAVAVIRSLWKRDQGAHSRVVLQVKGGRLAVEKTSHGLELIGPSHCVFRGEIDLT